MASRVTSAPSWAKARTAASSSSSRLRRASARTGRPRISDTGHPLQPTQFQAWVAKRRWLRLGWAPYRRFLRFGAYRVRLGYGSPDTRESTMTVTTPITTPFKWETTAAEVVGGIDLGGSPGNLTGWRPGTGL